MHNIYNALHLKAQLCIYIYMYHPGSTFLSFIPPTVCPHCGVLAVGVEPGVRSGFAIL